MNVELESIKIPDYPSGSYNFIRRLRNLPIPEDALPKERCLGTSTDSNGVVHPKPANAEATTGRSNVKLDIAIIGAGVAGLSNAIALKQAGHAVTVYEQASALSEIGAGIQIPPNSSRILHSWGLKTTLERRSVTPSSLLWRRWETGAVIGCAKLNPASMHRYGSPYYVTHRAHLHDVLHERTKELQIPIYLNRRVHDYDAELGKVVFAGGEVVTKDLVIAADGLKSIARRVLNGSKDKGPQGHGLAAYRGTINMASIKSDPLISWIAKTRDLNLWVGHNRHVMSYAISGGERFNVVVTHPSEPEDAKEKPVDEVLDKMRSYFAGWDPCLTRLLELVDYAVDWPIYCIEIPPKWSSASGRTIITGDAAHAMVPYMALGAAMAVEDAAALAATLTHLRNASEGELKRTVSKWMEARVPRVNQVHAASFGHGLILHFPDGPVQIARDEALESDLGDDQDHPVSESPNQWNDPTVTHWAYTHDPVAEVERIWAKDV